MYAQHTKVKIATMRVRHETEWAELDYLDGLVQGGGDEFVEDLLGRWGDAATECGNPDERLQARAISYAGLSAYGRR